VADDTFGTEIDGIIASELRDTQSEILDVKGADITELEAGRGYFNTDHRNGFSDVVGRVTKARKIFGPEDCEDERQKYYWNKLKVPLVYASGYLFDKDGDHRSAKAAAAILRNQARTDSPLKLKASVEGGIIERGKTDPRLLKRTKITKVALTFTPANNNTLIETPRLEKCQPQPGDIELIREFLPMAFDDAPSFHDLGQSLTKAKIEANVLKIVDKIRSLKK
jgi:hypothetical protein